MRLAPEPGPRRALTWLGLAAVVAALAWDVHALERDSVAWTWSLGGGWGATRRTARYWSLPPVLRASADAHEAYHLEHGTWRVWRVRADELEAYRAQADWLEHARAVARERGLIREEVLLGVEAAGIARSIESLRF